MNLSKYWLTFLASIALLASCGSGSSQSNEDSETAGALSEVSSNAPSAEDLAEAARLDSIRQDSIIEAALREVAKKEKRQAEDFKNSLPDLKKLYDLDNSKRTSYLRDLGFTGSMKGDEGEFELISNPRKCFIETDKKVKSDGGEEQSIKIKIEGDKDAFNYLYKKALPLKNMSKGDLTVGVEKKDNTIIISSSLKPPTIATFPPF